MQGGLNLLAFQVDANVARLMLPSQVDTTIIGSAELLWKGVDGSVVLSVRSDIHVSVVLRVRSGIHVSVVLSGRSGVHVSAALAMYQVCPFCTHIVFCTAKLRSQATRECPSTAALSYYLSTQAPETNRM